MTEYGQGFSAPPDDENNNPASNNPYGENPYGQNPYGKPNEDPYGPMGGQPGGQMGGGMPPIPPNAAGYRSTGNTYTWQETWQLVLTKPSEESFEEILGDPAGGMNRAVTWMFVVGLIAGVASFIGQLVFGAASFAMLGGGEDAAASTGFSLICSAMLIPLTGVFAVIGLIIGTGFVHIIAKLFGGQGDFDHMAYATASYSAPLTVISALLNIIPFLGACLSGLLGLYQLVLQVMAVKVVHKFGWFQAIMTVFAPAIFIFILAFCCFLAFAGSLASSDLFATPTPFR